MQSFSVSTDGFHSCDERSSCEPEACSQDDNSLSSSSSSSYTEHSLVLDFSPTGVYVVVDAGESLSGSPLADEQPRVRAGSVERVQHQVHSSDQKMLIAMMSMVGVFALCEWVGGTWSGSLALLSDAFHMLSDFIALLVGLMAMRLALREKSRSKSYGWQRAGVIGALMNGVFLMSACIFILTDAIARLALDRQRIEEPLIVLVIGALGLVVNLIGLLMFCGHRHGHGHHSHGHHSHGHSHARDNGEATSAGSMNMHGVFLHILADALGSVVVIGVALLHLFTAAASDSWVAFVDPICSIALALFLIKTSYPLIRDSAHILMQSVPYAVDIKQIEQDILSVDGVDALHALHVWQLDEKRIVASVHVACSNLTVERFANVCRDIKAVMHRHDIHDSAVQPEFLHEQHDAKEKERRLSVYRSSNGVDVGDVAQSSSKSDSSCGDYIIHSPRTCVDEQWCCENVPAHSFVSHCK